MRLPSISSASLPGHDFGRIRVQRQDTGISPVAPAEPLQFTYSPGLDPELQARFNRMVLAMKEQGIPYKAIDGVRPSTRAHKLSTAYHIRERGAVPVADLQALTDGKDLDGNTWFKAEWQQVPTLFGFGDSRAATDAEMLEKAKDNALALVQKEGADFLQGEGWLSSGTISCAYEGYAADDPRRKPNVAAVPVSSHVSGNAIDLSGIDWTKLGGPWSEKAREFVAGFGLTRPFTPEAETYCIKEPWHFELAS